MYTPEQRVRSLSRREITVIYLTCMGLSLSQIAEQIKREVKTVQHYRTKAYKKLELDKFPDDQKLTYLQRDYCPIVLRLIKTPEDIKYWIPSDIDSGETLSIIKVEDDEDEEERRLGIIPYGDTRIIPWEEEKPTPPPPPSPPPPPEPWWKEVNPLLIILLGLGAIAIIYLLFRSQPLSEPVIQTLPPELITVIVTNTPEPVVETEVIVIPPTNTLEPTDTRTPLPTDTPRPTITPIPPSNVVSSFDGTSLDGWDSDRDLINPGASGNTGNDSDGYLRYGEQTAGAGGVSYFIAPRKFLKDWRTFKELRIDMWSSGGKFFTDDQRGYIGDVYIANGPLIAWYNLPSRPPETWQTYVIPLEDDGLWLFGPGTMDLDSVLVNVTEFKIRAEFGINQDESGLDNVTLVLKD